jgi:hypothetical protein
MLACALPLLLAAAGCASTKISEAERKAIRSVSVSPKVSLPEYPKVTGPEASKAGLIGGPFVLLATMHSENPDSTAFRKHLEEHKIDVSAIVRQAFLARLAAANAFPEVVEQGAQASFELSVESYGLAPGFSFAPVNKPLRPMLLVTGKLSGADGKVLWEHQASVTGLTEELPAYQFYDYLSNGARTRESLEAAASIAARLLLADLAGE